MVKVRILQGSRGKKKRLKKKCLVKMHCRSAAVQNQTDHILDSNEFLECDIKVLSKDTSKITSMT